MAEKGKAKKRIAMLGYGSQGSALALNLRDSGYDVIIGVRAGSKSRKRAEKDGFTHITTFRHATAEGDVICFAFPDHLHGRIYARQIAPSLHPGSTLLFLHGTSLAFGFVKPPKDCDVILIAPHAPGLAVRERFLKDRSVSAFYSIEQDASGTAGREIVQLARGMGFDRKRLLKTTARDESIGDLFGEQAVLCGGMAMLIRNGFDVLVEHGLKPEHAYLEVAYQLDLIVSLIRQFGIVGMLERISVAARFGSVETGPKIIDRSVKKRMKQTLRAITSGQFPRRLNQLDEKSIRKLDRRLGRLSRPSFEKASRKLR